MTSHQTYLTISQAAQRLQDGGLNVSARQIRRWVNKGQLAAVPLPNGRAQIHADDVDALLPARAAS